MPRASLAIALFLTCLCSTAPGVAWGAYVLTTIASFDGTNGSNPLAGLVIDARGNLYGTTFQGGAGGNGTAFRIDAVTGALTTIATFRGANGASPAGALILDKRGNLYGTTQYGGGGGQGTAFRIDAVTGALTTLATFRGPNGANPQAGLTLDARGNLYGTTYGGGGESRGTAFRIDATTGRLTTIVTFRGPNGANPAAGLTIDAVGNLYGTTQYGGTTYAGTAFRIDAVTGALTTLASFSYSHGANPQSGLTLDAHGNFYSTTSGDGEASYGTIFRIDAATGALSTLATFGPPNGINPVGSLTIDVGGNLYGTTISGGAFGQGTVFELGQRPR